MGTAASTTPQTTTVPAWFFSKLPSFSLSAKMKHAIKAALSLTLVYVIAFSQGWGNVMTAATTIIFIAVTDSLGDSILKGMLRIIGTVLGAVLGMMLIALFPQERVFYLAGVSIVVTVMLYLARAFRGDMTIFLLGAITLMTMFKNGAVDNVFLYGVDKTMMTVFGIAVYTLVGVFLWPVSLRDTSRGQAAALTGILHEVFQARHRPAREQQEKQEEMFARMRQLKNSVANIGSSLASGLSCRQWQSVVADFERVAEALALGAMFGDARLSAALSGVVHNYPDLIEETESLFAAVCKGWHGEVKIPVPPECTPLFDMEALASRAPLEAASLTSAVNQLANLHAALRRLAVKLNALNGPAPTRFLDEKGMKASRFLWLDVEDIKGAVLSFLIFWCATLLWITTNPPAGFFIVAMATGLSVITTFSPVKPQMMIVVYSISFIFSMLAYILILPHLATGWELALFLFSYAFIGFYFIIADLAALFLIGIVLLNISNQMFYAFDGFLIMLLFFYTFLFLLLIFYYLPFSTKPEHLFLILEKRFFTLCRFLLAGNTKKVLGRATLLDDIMAGYAKMHLLNTVEKMRLWGGQIDGRFFSAFPREKAAQFGKDCEALAHLLLIQSREERRFLDNPLIRAHVVQLQPVVGPLLQRNPGGKVTDKENLSRHKERITAMIEQELQRFFSGRAADAHDRETVLAFYEHLSLQKSILAALIALHDRLAALNLDVLTETRF
ncbi:MAG TPA: hypothetical protein ENJ30_09760 [Desulfobulbaceae bacterium]|nr:hypothetical protein [Desulfobulbaceae bacterium]